MKGIDPELELKYNKFYIGVSKYDKPFNFVLIQPKVRSLRIEPKLERVDDVEALLDPADLEVQEYDSRNQRYRIRLTQGCIEKNKALLKEILERAYREFNRFTPSF